MNTKNFYKKIFLSLEPKYILINKIFAFVMILSGISLLFRDEFRLAAIVDLTFGIVAVLLHLFRNKLSLNFRITVTLINSLLFAIQSLIRGSFLGNGLISLMMVIVISLAFLDLSMVVFFTIMVIAVMISLTCLNFAGILDFSWMDESRIYDAQDWVFQTISVIVFCLVSLLSVFSIKKMLIHSLSELESKYEEVKESEKLLLEQAYIDPLTGLHNRAYFLDKMILEENLPEGKKVVLIIVDVIHFRILNSMYGIEAGDRFLKTLGDIIKNNKLESSITARIGGNEFAVFVPMEKEIDIQEYISTYYNHLKETETFLKDAPGQRFLIAYKTFDFSKYRFYQAFNDVDMTIRYGKENELSGILSFDEEIKKKFVYFNKIREGIGKAIRNQEFYMCFQGKWDIREERITGYEALCRWREPNGRIIAPNDFIPIINKSFFMVEFGVYALKRSLTDFVSIVKRKNESFTLSLNISPVFFAEENFEQILLNEVNFVSLNNEKIILEITEDIFIGDDEKLKRKIERIRKRGFQISMDDFGTGYSSLSQLNSITLDELKVDKSLIQSLDKGEKSRVLCEAAVEIAKKMNLSIVAEGVETQEQADLVRTIGFHKIQGYLYSIPALPHDI